MAYSSGQISDILLKADKTVYKIGDVAYENMFSELDEAYDYERDIIFIYKKAVEYGDDYFVGTLKLDQIVERLAAKLNIYDYGTLAPIYVDVYTQVDQGLNIIYVLKTTALNLGAGLTGSTDFSQSQVDINIDYSYLNNVYVIDDRTLTLNGVTYDLSANRSWSISLDSVTDVDAVTTNKITVGGVYLTGMTAGSGALYYTGSRLTLANYNAGGTVYIEVNGGSYAAVFGTDLSFTSYGTIGGVFNNATVDTDKFIVSDGGVLKYRTGAQLLSDIGGQPSGSYVPTTRTLTINGTAYDLSIDRSWSVGTVTSVDMSVPTGFSIGGNPITGSGTLALSFAAGYSLPTTASQSNWNTAYNNRITTLTTTGTSGPATLIANTLNIPNYGSVLTGYVPYTGATGNVDLGYNTLSAGFLNIIGNSAGATGYIGFRQDLSVTYAGINYTSITAEDKSYLAMNFAQTGSDYKLARFSVAGLTNNIQRTYSFPNASGTLALTSDIPIVTGYVPYTGATQDLDLGTYGLIGDFVRFNPSSSNIPSAEGVMSWDSSNGTVSLSLKGNSYSLPIGQSLVARVVNNTGAQLNRTDYRVVRVSSAQGQRLAVSLAQANNDANSADTIGVVCENISNNQEGFIVNVGEISEINTTGSLQGETWADGDSLYLSATTPGVITNIKPIAPNHGVRIGYVEYAHSQHGKIYVKIDNGYELDELHDVAPTPYVNKGVLYRDTALNLWKSATIQTLLGYTPANQATTLTINGTTYDLSANRTWSVGTITSLTGEATASGTGAVSVTLDNSAVIGKVLTGLNLTGGGTIASTDSILQAFGKVQNQISALVGGVMYKGVWDANVNSPSLTSSVGNKGDYYIVNVAGSTNLNGITDWRIGDWAIFNGSTWDKVDNTDAVSSVNTFTGAVSLTTANIPEVTNLYYTDARSRSALSFAAGSGNYSTSTGVITIPTNTNQLTNGANFITLASISASSPLIYSSGALSIQVANSVQNGYLSSTDWNKFNNNIPAGVPSTGDYVFYNGSNLAYRGFIATSPLSYNSSTATFTISQATTSTDGYLSSTDWNTFNNKQSALTNPVTGTGTTNYVPKFTGSTTLGNSQIFDNGTNVGVGTASPSDKLEVNGNIRIPSATFFRYDGDTGLIGSGTCISGGTTSQLAIRAANEMLFSTGGATERMRLTSTGLGIGTSSPAYTLDVSGTGRFTNSVTATGGTASYSSSALPTATIITTTTGAINAAYTSIRIGARGQSGQDQSVAITNVPTADGNSAMTFTTMDNYSYAERLRLTSSGNLGLGVIPSAWGSGRTAIQLQGSSTAVYFAGEGNTVLSNNYYYNAGDKYIANGFSTQYLQGASGQHAWYIAPNNTSGAGAALTYTQAMTLDASGRLGIGTSSPLSSLDVRAASAANGNYQTIQAFSTDSAAINLGGGISLGGYYSGTSSIAQFASIWGRKENSTSGNYDGYLAFGTNSQATGVRELMRLNSSGNLGLGVTPSAWYSSLNGNAIELKAGSLYTLSNNSFYVNQNAYLNSSGSWIYVASTTASQYLQNGGTHIWNIAPSGTAGNAISFTQAMTLDASGRLGLGTTSPSEKLEVSGTSNIYAKITSTNSGNAGVRFNSISAREYGIFSDGALRFYDFTDATERMRITSGGNVGIGTTSPAGQFEVYTDGYRRLYTVYTDIYTTKLVLGANSYIQQDADNEELRISQQYGAGKITFYTGYPNSERLRITSGGLVGIGTTSPSALLDIEASTTSRASLRIRSGTAPTSPNDGDIWFDGTNLKIRIGGATKTFTVT